MIKAVIFDLDNCLAAADEVGRDLFEPAFEAMRHANAGVLSSVVLEEAFSECWRHPLDWVAEKYNFSPEMLAAGWEIFTTLEVSKPMRGYADLPVLSTLPVQRFLVTSGFRKLQESKIRALALKDFFAAIHVDAIDEPNRKGKEGLFQIILKGAGLDPSEAWVVGDNPDSEIAAGNRLGMKTVQILRPGVPRGVNATHCIHSLTELSLLLKTAHPS